MEQQEQDEGAIVRSRHDLITESSDDEEVQIDHIKVGFYYEIDHSKLHSSSPVQLQSVKIVMVSGKNERGVSVRYPSTFSLKSHFTSGNSGTGSRSGGSRTTTTVMQKASRLNPALDEKYSMENRVAAVALFRRIKPEEFVEFRGLLSFWEVGQSGSETQKMATRPASGGMALMGGSGGGSGLTVYQRTARNSKTGGCLSALKYGKVVRWGKRQRVRFVSNDDSAVGDDANPRVITPPNEDKSVGDEQLFKGKEQSDDESSEDEREVQEEEKEEEVKEEDDKALSDEEVKEEDEKALSDEEVKRAIPLRRNRKRKCKVVSYNQQIRIPKKQKSETIVRRKMGLARGQKRRGHKDSINRWSADRYKLAEENMMKIMKEKGAVFEKPILRQKLRDEARKVIGDTGLLDHLLKHMAGKVTPGGSERFRRRHNADGAMEYWLESAELVEIRKMAGVSDPYWKPPPGWELGDNPSQDPVCAMEIKQLKEDVDKLKRDLNELLLTKGQAEADVVATTPLSCVSEQNLINEPEVLPLKELHEELVKRKQSIEKQMIKVSQYLKEMEEEMEKLEKGRKAGSDGTVGSEKKDGEDNNDTGKTEQELQQQVMDRRGKGESEAAAGKTEEKAAMIQRLKSGFRICKPQGSFKWPNTAAAAAESSISSLEYHHLLAAQTPPSVSSTTTKSPSLPLLTQPPIQAVKPLARRHATNFPTFIDLNHTPAPAIQKDLYGRINHLARASSASHHVMGAQQPQYTGASSAADGSPTAAVTNTWVAVPTLNHLLRKSNQ